jgi:periplasmic protein TonB
MKHLIMKKVVIATQLFLTIGLFSTANAQVADTSKTHIPEKTERVHAFTEQQPQFPGGDSKLMEFISHNLRYPEIDLRRRVQGKVFVQFVVNRSGKVIDPKIVRSVSPTIDAEAIRVVNLLPDFVPGRQKGEAVSVTYILPVIFRLSQ